MGWVERRDKDCLDLTVENQNDWHGPFHLISLWLYLEVFAVLSSSQCSVFCLKQTDHRLNHKWPKEQAPGKCWKWSPIQIILKFLWYVNHKRRNYESVIIPDKIWVSVASSKVLSPSSPGAVWLTSFPWKFPHLLGARFLQEI
jgi:hypothetical protein